LKRRSIAVNSALALFGDVASKVSGIVVLAIAARWLTTEQFALLGASLAGVTILTAVLDGGLSMLIVRDGAADSAARTGTLWAGLVARAPILALAFAGAAIFGALRGELAPALLIVASSALGALALAVLALFRAAQDLSVEALQKLALGLLLPATVCVALAVEPGATTVLAAAALAQALALSLALSRRSGLQASPARRAVAETLKATVPFALMTIATLVYYRAGTLLLAAFRPAADTAAFTIASGVAIGLLALPNAITTGLLPSLSATHTQAERLGTARRALGWTLGLCIALVIVTALGAPPMMSLVFGHRFDAAVAPLMVLLPADLLIGVSGVLGVLLVASRRTRPLVIQVAASLVVNLALGALLIPRFGTIGGAADTLVTEVVAVAILAVALRRELPGLVLGSRSPSTDGTGQLLETIRA
jgi:O-antigen/teichoic acid export membrane protein